jgi:Transposase DDE domain group 1
MSIQPVWQETLTFCETVVVVEPSVGQLSSDAGLLPFRELDGHLGHSRAFAAVLNDPRDPDLLEHTMLEMVRARVYGILAGYRDQNDHDTLRSDPIFKLVADRSPDDAALASQPTLSRFENHIDIASLKRLKDVLIDQFIAAFGTPPRQLTFDIDAVDDPAHGHQQLTLWHGYYDQNQYLPLLISCADNDLLVMLSLRPGNVHASLGADDDLAYLVGRLRQVWPDVHISVRGDCGFGLPRMYDICESLRINYTFGLTTNVVLQRQTEALLAQAVATFAQEQQAVREAEEWRPAQPARLFSGFAYQAGTWPTARYVVAKAEANTQGTNRRFVVSNRPGAELYPEATYDDYVQRGESENRNKEFKCDLGMDRLSDHRFCANYFRLYLHALAMNLLVRLRRLVADPPSNTAASTLAGTVSGSAVAEAEPVPAEAQTGAARRRRFRQRRQRDPLGEGQPCTWWQLVIKVAAAVVVSARRVVVRLSSSWPHLGWYRQVCERLHAWMAAAAAPG